MHRLARSIGVLILVFGCVVAFNPEEYTNSKLIEPLDYTVYWRLDFPNNLIYIALRVKTTGWIGFGISELTSGSMPGADIVEGQVQDGVGTITDRWSSAFAMPEVDDCQDWMLVAAEEVDGYTTLEVKRPINTTDPQDRSIVYGTNMIIAAHGPNGKDTFGYHSTTRATSEIIFFGEPAYDTTPPDDERTISLRMSNYVVPNRVTTYACQAFTVPVDQEYHIIQIEPIINETNVAHVHHFLVHTCVNTSADPIIPGEPGVCNDMDFGLDCSGLLGAWAAGGGSTYTPPEAGFRMGPMDKSIKYIILEVHYNNVDRQGGYADNSGIILHYTPTLRKYDAGVIMIGDVSVEFPPIPPNTPATHYESECLSECTQEFTHDIQIFSSFPHMHQVGTQIWTTQWRGDEQIAEHGRIEFWTFDHQTTQAVNFTMKPGDRLNLHCVYNTEGVATPTTFGLASNEEMCLAFYSYYPRVFTKQGDEYSFCGNLWNGMSLCGLYEVMNISNPQHIDPPGGEERIFGESSTCAPTSTTSPPKSHAFVVLLTASVCGAAILIGAAILGYRKYKETKRPLDQMELQLVPQTEPSETIE